MNRIIKVKASSFITRSGKLVNRKSSRRILGSKVPLSQAKERVRKLRLALDKLKTMTANDPDKLEYGVILNNIRKDRKQIPISKGYIRVENGVKIPTVELPPVKKEGRSWLLHSHPDAIPLSLADVMYSNKKGGTIFAIDKDGSVYRSTRLVDAGRENTKRIEDVYQEARKKIRASGLIKEAFEIDKMFNPSVSDEVLKEDLFGVVQHKLLTHLHNQGLIRYRAKLSPAMTRKINRDQGIMSAELKKNNSNIINFNKYHIPKSKWYKLSKTIRNKIRKEEVKYNFDYDLAARKSKVLQRIHKQLKANS